MTAPTTSQRLESPGLWRADATAQRREVTVALRDTSLILFDPRTDLPLSHWSLASLKRSNPGETPALFTPGTDAEESVEIGDEAMVAALEKVRQALRRRRSRPGRLRGSLLATLLVGVVLVAVVFLPERIYSHTARVVPHAMRSGIGAAALSDLQRLTGAACGTPQDNQALAALSERLFGAGGPLVLVLRDGLTRPASLPGPILLLPQSVVESASAPEAVAGYLLAEDLRIKAQEPLVPVLHHAGLMATLRLLTTGRLPDGVTSGYGEAFLARSPVTLPDEALLAAFDAAGVSSAPYGYALDPTGETTLGLIEADPWRAGSRDPVLAAQDWAAVQSICN